MKLKIINVGKIYEPAEIELDGITVLAGVNGTGKSTVAKCLYVMFDTFKDINFQVKREKERAIRRIISVSTRDYMPLQDERRAIDDVFKKIEQTDNQDELNEYLKECFNVDDEILSIMSEQIWAIIKSSDEDIKKMLLDYRLKGEFGGQLANVNQRKTKSKIELEIQNKKLSCEVNGEISICSEISLDKDIIYIDNNGVSSYFSFDARIPMGRRRYQHSEKMIHMLSREKRADFTAVDDVLKNDMFKRIFDVIAKTGAGSIVSDDRGRMTYREDGLKKDIYLGNVSSGIRIFSVIKQLIINGYLEENGIVILDEPEVNLHPEWQKVLAEIIVMLNIEIGINFLISTHSADFLTFIEYYSSKHNDVEKLKCYMIEKENNSTSVIEDVSTNIDKIYDRIGTPMIDVVEEMS